MHTHSISVNQQLSATWSGSTKPAVWLPITIYIFQKKAPKHTMVIKWIFFIKWILFLKFLPEYGSIHNIHLSLSSTLKMNWTSRSYGLYGQLVTNYWLTHIRTHVKQLAQISAQVILRWLASTIDCNNCLYMNFVRTYLESVSGIIPAAKTPLQTLKKLYLSVSGYTHNKIKRREYFNYMIV